MTSRLEAFALFVAVLAESDRLHPGPRGPLPPQEMLGRAMAFRRIARALERYAVAEHNGTLSDRQATARDRAIHAARSLAKMIGANAIIGGDPRGYALKLQLPTDRSNTWGGSDDGWGVPA